ncbi:hypothetical protein SVIO_027380 [Streptomyces violaceusniger]|uniref:Uncharacterized protein n=1 Tax=Streptomyces violaceusniger TaxID=68280 RepID=A0A4D4KT47_STRVO|nr:hypothetical protein SVIO_027380 [Streptomyces violaceusniger]
MASPEQFTMPAQHRVGPDQQQKVPQPVFGEVVEQAGEGSAISVGEGGDAYTPRGVLDGGEDVQACSGQRPGFEEVGGKNCVCSAAEEGGPGLAVALGCGIDAVVLEDLPYRGGGLP